LKEIVDCAPLLKGRAMIDMRAHRAEHNEARSTCYGPKFASRTMLRATMRCMTTQYHSA